MNDQYGTEAYPWEKLPEETAASFGVFVLYRGLGYKRTLREAAKIHYEIGDDAFQPEGEHQGKVRQVEKWSALYQWVRRAEQYDAFVQKMADADDFEAVKKMKTRQAAVSQVLQTKVAQALQAYPDTKLASMSLDSLARVFDIAVKQERLARGVPETTLGLVGADGGAVQVEGEVDTTAIERKLEAFLAARDSSNTIESGEPPRPDDDLDVQAASWPSATPDAAE